MLLYINSININIFYFENYFEIMFFQNYYDMVSRSCRLPP